MRTLLITLCFLLFAIPAQATVVVLSWDAPTLNADGSTLDDLGGYRLYRGTSPGVYTESIDVGNVTTFQWDIGNVEGQEWYFNVTAYDLSGNESVYNGEVNVNFPGVPPASPQNLSVTIQ